MEGRNSENGIRLTDLGKESRRIIAMARREAEGVLEKARAILEEARSFQTSLDNSVSDQQAEARRIGFDEGFRVGRARGEEAARAATAKEVLTGGDGAAVEMLEEAACRLREALDRFEDDRRKYLADLAKLVRKMSVGVDGKRRDLPASLARLIEEAPRAEIRPEDEVWLETSAVGGRTDGPPIVHTGEGSRGRRASKRHAASSTRGRGRRRRGSTPR